MDEAQYWKARVVLMEVMRACERAEAVRAAEVKRIGEDAERRLGDLGVPWAKSYRWDDVALTIEASED